MIFLMFAILLFMAHYVGDFRLQSREVANTKSYDNKSLFIHGLTFSAPLAIVFAIMYPFCHTYTPLILVHVPAAIIINMVLHMIQDRLVWRGFKKKVIAEGLKQGTPEWESQFFTVLGADQMIHMIVLFTIIYLFIL